MKNQRIYLVMDGHKRLPPPAYMAWRNEVTERVEAWKALRPREVPCPRAVDNRRTWTDTIIHALALAGLLWFAHLCHAGVIR